MASIAAPAADSAAGQKTFATTCAGCHQLKSYAGKSDAELETELKGIVGGTVKHPKKLTLSADDIAERGRLYLEQRTKIIRAAAD